VSINDERGRILRMVAEGSVTPAEAEDLLAALEPPRAEGRPWGAPGTVGPPFFAGSQFFPAPPAPPGSPRPASRNLIIHISEGKDTKVNVRIPLNLARAAGKFIPRHAQHYLDNFDISLDDLLASLADNSGGGTLLEVHDGEDTVIITVE